MKNFCIFIWSLIVSQGICLSVSNAADSKASGARGYFDSLAQDTGTAFGWAGDPAKQSEALSIQFYVNDFKGSNPKNLMGTVKANMPRKDLSSAGFSDLNHGFAFKIPQEFKNGENHTISVFAIEPGSGKKVELGGSPKLFKLN